MPKNIYKSIIIGSIWGFIEATLGYLLHMVPMDIGSFFWFPIAYFFIYKSYAYTKKYSCVILTSSIASCLKLINLFFPNRIDMVINPAISIILESFSVILVFHYIQNKNLTIFHLGLIGFTYRTLYLSYLFLLPEQYLILTQAANVTKLVKFLFLENVTNTLLIYLCLTKLSKIKIPSFEILKDKVRKVFIKEAILTPIVSIFLISLAIFSTVICR